MPVPRRFDRRPPERDTTRINDRIRVPEVRVIGEDGDQIGVMRTEEALRYAQERDLDLVEVAPEARPPVTRILDYSKYKYEQAQKAKAARKHQQQITIREIKFRPKIAQNDYDTKKGHVIRFLRRKDKVKVTIMFRGREVTHPERGQMLLERLAEELGDLTIVEQRPNLDGRNMTMMLGPSKSILAGTYDAEKAAEAQAAAAQAAAAADDEEAARVASLAERETPAAAEPTVAAEPEVAAEAEVAPEPDAVAEPEPDAGGEPEAQPEPEAKPEAAPRKRARAPKPSSVVAEPPPAA